MTTHMVRTEADFVGEGPALGMFKAALGFGGASGDGQREKGEL